MRQLSRYLANLLIGSLCDENSSKLYLISTKKELERTNNATVARFIREELTNFFLPEQIPTDKIILMLSDTTPH
jgi:hypothetical protein